MARLLISATHKSSGKTTLSIGIGAALRAQGLDIQAFKKGPDYIDPLWLGAACGRPCHNLDFHTMTPEEMLCTVNHYSADADFALIEANKGLFDGMALDGSDSNAALAYLLKAPVILVVDTRGMTRGIAPLLMGYQHFDANINLAGIILNRVGGERHATKLRQAIEHYTDIPVVGVVQENPELAIEERHLGLIPSNELHLAAQQIERIRCSVAQQVDLELLQSLALTVDGLPLCNPELSAHFHRFYQGSECLRIGIAQDAAFGFYYPGDLNAFSRAGVELVPINTLTDNALPPIDGLFIGGGFPETHMQALAENSALRTAIFHAIEQGLPTYAECGGLMYLARSVEWQGYQAPMVGIIPGDIVMHAKPQGRGYVTLRETADMPWVTNASTTAIRAHEFHYSSLTNLTNQGRFAYQVERGVGINGHYDGWIYRNLLASYTHLRDTSKYRWVERFVEFVRQHKRTTSA